MTREIGCPTCGRTFVIAESDAESTAKCPFCEGQNTLPTRASANNFTLPATGSENSQTEWYLLTPEGAIYGPISWPDVLQWASEGRIDGNCKLGQSTTGPWRAAGEVLPVLQASPPAPFGEVVPPVAGSQVSPMDVPAAESRSSAFAPPAPGVWVAPHRGPIIFILGLLGLVVGCPVFSFAAWAMATRDLAEMRSGRMDQRGEGLTLGGLILGLIASLMWLVCLLGVLLVLLVYAASRL